MMDPTEYTYTLELSASINKLSTHGGYTGERLTVNQAITLKASNLTTLFGILARFQELGEAVKAEHGGKPPI